LDYLKGMLKGKVRSRDVRETMRNNFSKELTIQQIKNYRWKYFPSSLKCHVRKGEPLDDNFTKQFFSTIMRLQTLEVPFILRFALVSTVTHQDIKMQTVLKVPGFPPTLIKEKEEEQEICVLDNYLASLSLQDRKTLYMEKVPGFDLSHLSASSSSLSKELESLIPEEVEDEEDSSHDENGKLQEEDTSDEEEDDDSESSSDFDFWSLLGEEWKKIF
jgi:hypothetical protein